MKDPTGAAPAVEDASGSRTLFVLALLAVVSIPQLMIFMSAHGRKERFLSAGLLAVAVAIAWSRY